jgi:hypothetical protein
MARSLARKLVLLAILPSCLFSQSVVKKIFSGATSFGTSAAIPNQGQTTHSINVQYIGAACSTTIGYVQLEASYDGTVYFGITAAPLVLTPILSGASGMIGNVSISGGPYPYVRGNLYNTPPAGCAVTVWYSGSTSSVAQPQMLQSITGQWKNRYVTGSTATVQIAGDGSTRRSTLYSLTFSNLNTTDPMQVVVFESNAAATCGTVTVTYGTYAIPAGATVTFPGSQVPWVKNTNPATAICGTFTGTALSYSSSAVYRMEQ